MYKWEEDIGNSYGYAGHKGVDISYAYAGTDVDKSKCKDYPGLGNCPYIRGPGIFTAMDGKLVYVSYNPHNDYHNTGETVGQRTDGKLNIDGNRRSWGSFGCHVKIENTDGSTVIYAHLYPDYDFFKQLSEHIGETLSAGTFIGYMGNTGNSSGLHLHIEFTEKGKARSELSSLTTGVYLKKIAEAMNTKLNIT